MRAHLGDGLIPLKAIWAMIRFFFGGTHAFGRIQSPSRYRGLLTLYGLSFPLSVLTYDLDSLQGTPVGLLSATLRLESRITCATPRVINLGSFFTLNPP